MTTPFHSTRVLGVWASSTYNKFAIYFAVLKLSSLPKAQAEAGLAAI